jgi:hypothetical protein
MSGCDGLNVQLSQAVVIWRGSIDVQKAEQSVEQVEPQ